MFEVRIALTELIRCGVSISELRMGKQKNYIQDHLSLLTAKVKSSTLSRVSNVYHHCRFLAFSCQCNGDGYRAEQKICVQNDVCIQFL